MFTEKIKTGYPSIDKTHEENISFISKHPLIPNISVYTILSLIGKMYKNDFAVDCHELEATFYELFSDVSVLASAFNELGVKSKDIVAVSMPNLYQAIVSFLAANKIGAVTTFLNFNSKIEEQEYYLNLFESPLFLNYDKSLEYNQHIMRNTKVNNLITLDKKDVFKKGFSSCKEEGLSSYWNYRDLKIIANVSKFRNFRFFGKNQDALVLFTSGSTGNPKSVILTNENLLASGIYMKNSTSTKITNKEKCLVAVPFCYPYGFATSVLMSLMCGREVILAPNLSADSIGYYYAKNPNIIFGSPAMLELTMKNVEEHQDLSSTKLFISGGDFLFPSKSRQGKEFFATHGADVEMCNGSGNAETTATSTTAVGVPNRPDTVGKVLYGSKAIVIDPDTMEEKKYGEEGLLCISGKHVFREYFKDSVNTEDAFITFKGQKYFKTGSLGILDEEGYFKLTNRESRFYIISTLNKIYCDHVQGIISNIDVVDSCAVVSVPDDEMLFKSYAYITLKDGITYDFYIPEYIKEKCLSPIADLEGNIFQLKPYEIPANFEIVDVLPRKKDSEKIDYSVLEADALEKERNSKKEYQKIFS